MITIWC